MSVEGVSLIFPCRNRLEFTRQSWAALMQNTDWSLVSEFHVYDDGSTDGTREWLRPGGGAWAYGDPIGYLCAQHHDTEFHSPMGVTIDWIKRSQAPILAKLDNDTIYPPGWLNVALDVMERHPELDMLGLEAMRAIAPIGGNTVHDYLPAQFISGLGLYRRAAFADQLPVDGGYFGLEEFQMQTAGLTAGWILPSLPVFLLDRMPMEPWRSLSEEYVRKSWQRPWSLDLRYRPEESDKWSWWKAIE